MRLHSLADAGAKVGGEANGERVERKPTDGLGTEQFDQVNSNIIRSFPNFFYTVSLCPADSMRSPCKCTPAWCVPTPASAAKDSNLTTRIFSICDGN
jgi:hypothetical protein